LFCFFDQGGGGGGGKFLSFLSFEDN